MEIYDSDDYSNGADRENEAEIMNEDAKLDGESSKGIYDSDDQRLASRKRIISLCIEMSNR